MQLDLPDPPKNVPEHTTLTPKASSQSIAPSIPIPGTMPSTESQIVPLPQVPGAQSPLSTVNVDIPMNRRETPEVLLQKEEIAQRTYGSEARRNSTDGLEGT
jgi:hypothetical protein